MEPNYRWIALTKLLRKHAQQLEAIAQTFDDGKPVPSFMDIAAACARFCGDIYYCAAGEYDHTLGGKPVERR